MFDKGPDTNSVKFPGNNSASTPNSASGANDESRRNGPITVSDRVRVQANIKINPKVVLGEIKTFYDEPMIGKGSRISCPQDPCEFLVSQDICVQIPITFSAETTADPGGYMCGTPELAPCHKC